MKPIIFSPIVRFISKLLIVIPPVIAQPVQANPTKPTYALCVPADVPEALITNDSTYWTITTLSNLRYVNTTPGPYYNSYKTGGGMLVKFKFLPNGRYKFQLYVQANTYGTDTETWTEVEGNVEFSKDGKGTYLWDVSTLAGDNDNLYLLMVDLEQHPNADVSNPSTIDPGWVSKFHIPFKK